DEPDRARSAWRRRIVGAVIAVLALTVLLTTGPFLDARARARTRGEYVAMTVAVAVILVLGRALLFIATPADGPPGTLFAPIFSTATRFGLVLRSAADVLLTALMLTGLVGLLADVVGRARREYRTVRRDAFRDLSSTALFLAPQVVAAAGGAALVCAY